MTEKSIETTEEQLIRSETETTETQSPQVATDASITDEPPVENDENDIEENMDDENDQTTSAASTQTTTQEEIQTTTEATTTKVIQFIQKQTDEQDANETQLDQVTAEVDAEVQNLRALKSSSKQNNDTFNLIRSASPSASSSSYSVVAIWTIIGLLCFSLLINVLLLYVVKERFMSRRSDKLIITHEICGVGGAGEANALNGSSSNTKTGSSASQRSDDLTECNINLINHSGHNQLDLDH